MALARIFYPGTLKEQSTVALADDSAHHLSHVLRLKIDEPLIIFNGQGGEFYAKLASCRKNKIEIHVEHYIDINRESPLAIHLGQVISKSTRMDYSLQKSVELGVTAITPLISERCQVKLNTERTEKKMRHWQGILISACQQSGRTAIPQLNTPRSLLQWLKTRVNGICLAAHVGQRTTPLRTAKQPHHVNLLIGGESGFSDGEIQTQQNHGFHSLSLGPRTLRTETAAPIAIALLQQRWGDIPED